MNEELNKPLAQPQILVFGN